MKVLQVSSFGFADPRFYRSNELTLSESLVKLGHQVTIFTSSRHPKWQMLDKRDIERKIEMVDGFTVRRFPSGPELGTVPIMPTLLKEIVRFEFDVLHAHTILAPSSFYSSIASLIKKRPLVVTQHDYAFGAAHGIKLFFHMMNNCTLGRFTMKRASTVIGLSSAAVGLIQRFGAVASKTRFIPNSVDTNVFRPNQRNLLKERWGIEEPVILFVGRLTRHKAVDTLIHAFSKVALDVPKAKLVIVGKGPDESSLLALKNELKLSQVIFLGRVPWDEMRYIYPGCDILALPSTYEPFGNVVLEALASGLPVIGSRIGGMIDIITHGETGYHVEPKDSERLAYYMRKLLIDEELRSKMSTSARRAAVEKFDDMVIAEAVEEVYYECCKR